mmetsp:Transcript_47929/g.133176  ORF Transcript_47929/g.133176 Transcript_47929/m.133176 type:complete len:293 (-) Transcript_47929:1671-2549(-)
MDVTDMSNAASMAATSAASFVPMVTVAIDITLRAAWAVLPSFPFLAELHSVLIPAAASAALVATGEGTAGKPHAGGGAAAPAAGAGTAGIAITLWPVWTVRPRRPSLVVLCPTLLRLPPSPDFSLVLCSIAHTCLALQSACLGWQEPVLPRPVPLSLTPHEFIPLDRPPCEAPRPERTPGLPCRALAHDIPRSGPRRPGCLCLLVLRRPRLRVHSTAVDPNDVPPLGLLRNDHNLLCALSLPRCPLLDSIGGGTSVECRFLLRLVRCTCQCDRLQVRNSTNLRMHGIILRHN